jgi:DNA-directed RNA polymerase subunit F
MFLARFGLALALVTAAAGCNQKSLEEQAKIANAGAGPGGLTVAEASKVLARVGERTITLGDYAAALERMNEFDRMRYQSPEKRRDLLNEMIDFELLAIEAQRRGLDRTPETEETIRQVLRDALLADSRKGLPTPVEIPTPEVRAYYDTHLAEFREPERRRVSAIVLKDRAEAEKVLPDAKKASPMEWGKLVIKYAEGPPQKPSAAQPLESFGDLGIVSAPDDPRGDPPRVPPEVRAAIFEIKGDVGAVLDRVVESKGRFYLIKMAGKSAAHERAFAEAERSIRGILLQQKVEAREREVEEQLRKDFPVSVDEAALSQVQVPGGAPRNSLTPLPMVNPGAPSPAGSR